MSWGPIAWTPDCYNKGLVYLPGVDPGQVPGATGEDPNDVRELKRRVAEPERTVHIMRAATAFVTAAQPDAAVICVLSPSTGINGEPLAIGAVLREHGHPIASRTYYGHASRHASMRVRSDAPRSTAAWSRRWPSGTTSTRLWRSPGSTLAGATMIVGRLPNDDLEIIDVSTRCDIVGITGKAGPG